MQDNQNSKKYNKILVISVFLAVFFGITLANISGNIIQGFISGLLASLTPIIFAIFVIFILKHLMYFLESKVLVNLFNNFKYSFKIKRIISLTLSFLVLFFIFYIVLSMFVPRIIEIASELVINKDRYIYQIKMELGTFISTLLGNNSEETINSIMVSLSTYLENAFNDFLPQLLQVSTTTIMVLGQCLLGFVLAWLYLYNKESINEFFVKIFKKKKTEQQVNFTTNYVKKSDQILLDYFVAKIIEAVVITVFVGITLSVLQIPYAFELALIIGILNAIPYVGLILALIPTSLITLIYGSVNLVFEMLIIVIIVCSLLTTFVTPFIVGKKIKLNILVLLLSMIVGGGMFGILGMAFAPPMACVIIEYFKQKSILNETTQSDLVAEEILIEQGVQPDIQNAPKPNSPFQNFKNKFKNMFKSSNDTQLPNQISISQLEEEENINKKYEDNSTSAKDKKKK